MEDEKEHIMERNIDAVCEDSDKNIGENHVLVLQELRHNNVHEEALTS